MKLRLGLLFLFTITSIAVFSQTDTLALDKKTSKNLLKTYGKLDFGFSGLGLSLETPISDKILFEVAAGLGAGYKVNEDFKYRFYFDNPAVFATLHGKYYYNQQDRVDKGRPVSFNAGNFVGLKVKYASPTLRERKTWNTMLVGFHWGMQRKMGKHFVYQMDLGVGAAIDLEGDVSTHMTLFPDANFRISYVLPFH